jgi:hypothetical protein
MHLTNNESIRNETLVAPDRLDAAGAPANEIEVTPEMIEAGVEYVWMYDYRIDDPKKTVENIIKAALANRA